MALSMLLLQTDAQHVSMLYTNHAYKYSRSTITIVCQQQFWHGSMITFDFPPFGAYSISSVKKFAPTELFSWCIRVLIFRSLNVSHGAIWFYKLLKVHMNYEKVEIEVSFFWK
jgi:hypothetical protein